MYPQEELRVPENFLPEYAYNEAIGSGRNLLAERLAPSLRVPFIMAAPGINERRRIDAPIYLQDIETTTLELQSQMNDPLNPESAPDSPEAKLWRRGLPPEVSKSPPDFPGLSRGKPGRHGLGSLHQSLPGKPGCQDKDLSIQ